VLPTPETTATLALAGLDDARAIEALCLALGSPYEVTGAAHLPAGLDGDARTLLRIEGFEASVAYRAGELARLLKRFGPTERIAADPWEGVRDVLPLVEPRERAVWRVSTAPTRGPAVTAAVARTRDARWFYDWGGGLVWIATDAAGDAGAAEIRAAVAAVGGHATLVRAPRAVRAAVPVFAPQPEPLMRVSRGIKAALDPHGLFSPGRMHAGL
jgi:glycolate oxidase FAD binding subunit